MRRLSPWRVLYKSWPLGHGDCFTRGGSLLRHAEQKQWPPLCVILTTRGPKRNRPPAIGGRSGGPRFKVWPAGSATPPTKRRGETRHFSPPAVHKLGSDAGSSPVSPGSRSAARRRQLDENYLPAIRQVPPTWPDVRPCRVHGRCGQAPASRRGLAAIRQVPTHTAAIPAARVSPFARVGFAGRRGVLLASWPQRRDVAAWPRSGRCWPSPPAGRPSRPRVPPFARAVFTGGIGVVIASPPGVATWTPGDDRYTPPGSLDPPAFPG